jgi:hypothetical protein
MTCSQIWQVPLVNDSQPTYLAHKFEKQKKHWDQAYEYLSRGINYKRQNKILKKML